MLALRFWDASAVVPLLVGEPASRVCRKLWNADPEQIVWWGTELECVSAICRRERADDLDARTVAAALERLDALRTTWSEVQPVEGVRRVARRLMRVHPLRTADAAQLAAAIVCSDGQPDSLPFACLDRRLSEAAEREGFDVLPIPAAQRAPGET